MVQAASLEALAADPQAVSRDFVPKALGLGFRASSSVHLWKAEASRQSLPKSAARRLLHEWPCSRTC